MKRMVLVDGSNHAFRAYFALPPMHAPDGFPTNALYGFTQLFSRLIRQWEPDYCVVSFDRGKPFRKDLYAEYKGHRPQMPDDLRAQWPHFEALVEGFGFRAITLEGYEADDVMGTLATRYGGPDMEVLLVTGDKDMYQLVNEHVRVLDLMKDKEFGAEEVFERMGVYPNRIADLRGLAGDSSDNIPGVPGIGDKTAAKLLAEYDTVEGILENADKIKGKRGENIRSNADMMVLSKQLATIFTEVPMDEDLTTLAPRGIQQAELGPLFERWNFGTMARRLLRTGPSVDTSRYRAVAERAELESVAEGIRAAGRLSLRIETKEKDLLNATWAGVGLCWSNEDAVYVPLAHDDDDPQATMQDFREVFGSILADASIAKIGSEMKSQWKLCALAGLPLNGVAGDTGLLDYVLAAHERSHSLPTLAQRHLTHRLSEFKPDAKSADRGFHLMMVDEAAHFGCEAAHVAWLLHGRLVPLLDEGMKWIYEQVEVPLLPVLGECELNGIALDESVLGSIRETLTRQVNLVENSCFEIVGREFNVGSVPELRKILFDELGYEPTKKTKTGFSTDSSVLEALSGQQDPDLPAHILRWRELTKLLSTYVDKLPKEVHASDRRIHTTFSQTTAATGRLSSVDPNLQNIPIRTEEGRRIREAFVPVDGTVFLSCDYSQVELRILAHVTGSTTLQDAFTTGVDIHVRTASEVFGVPIDEVDSGLRNAAKAVNYGLLYGQTAFGLAATQGISRGEAQAYMDEYFSRMPEVEGWIRATKAEAKKEGNVRTLFGRKRILPEINSKAWPRRAAAEREAVNTVIQGTAADIMKIAMLRVHRALENSGLKARILLQVHDELLLEVPTDEVDAVRAIVTDEMRGAGQGLSVPLDVNAATGLNWRLAHG